MQAKAKVRKALKKVTSVKSKLTPKSRQVVDDVLVKVSPQVQKRVDQLIDTLKNSKEARMGDLKWIAGQILLRSKEISAQIKNNPLSHKVVTVAKKQVVRVKSSAKAMTKKQAAQSASQKKSATPVRKKSSKTPIAKKRK